METRFLDTGFGNIFWMWHQNHIVYFDSKSKQAELHQTKRFCPAKETNDKMKRQPTKGKNILIFVSHISDKGLIYKKYKELIHACMQIMSLQSCLTLFDPMDRRLPDSSVHETPQARILEWVAFPSPGEWKERAMQTADGRMSLTEGTEWTI